MYLKRIESYGFKSFAHRISIDFGEGMTAIVGPNGSGKSNVVDAVRWVLGEQSAKTLRGGTMQDVIFKGSSSRKQLGFAEVTLVLENSDRTLPVEYEEVSVKRRLYRTGESNYFLNNQKVRLQDITNLFMDSGIGKESFSIIGQGKIDEILNSKPIERRAIFEETAGVLKYKTRKEQSLRRLEKTHANLLRVTDVIKELSHQLSPLKKQAEQATTYLEYKQELSSLEISLLAHEIRTLREEYDEIGETSKKHTIEIANQVLIIEETIKQIDLLDEETKLLDEQIEKEQGLLLLATQEAEEAKGAEKMQEQKRGHLTALIEQVTADIKELNEKIERVNDLEKKSSNVNFAEKIATAKHNEQRQVQVMQDNMANIEELRKNVIGLSGQLQAQTSRKDTLNEVIDSLQNLFQGVREVLKAKSNKQLTGIHGTVLDLIEVEDNFAKAIEVSFANALQFVVTEDQKGAENAIRYLKKNRLGKATFLPLNVIRGRKISEDKIAIAKKHQGFVGIASDLVTYDKKFESILFQLLGQTIVADSLQNANMLAKSLQFQFRIVTLDGEIVHRGGSLTGGEAKYEKSGLLLQKQELKKLKAETVKLEKQLQALNLKLNQEVEKTKNEEEQLQSLREATRTIEQQQQLFEHQLSQMQDQRIDLTAQLEQLSSRKQTHIEELDNLEIVTQELMNQTTEFDSQRENKLVLINELRGKRVKQEQEKSDVGNTLKAAQNEERQLDKKLQKLELNQNTAQIKIDEKVTRLQDTYGHTYESVQNFEIEQPYDEVGGRVKTLRSNLDRMGMVNLGAIEEYERVYERHEYLEEQKADLDEAEENLLAIIEEMDVEMEERFKTTFQEIQENFQYTFKEMFGGGSAELRLEDTGDYLTSGIEIFTQPPGKKIQNLSLLSGGERALTAIALLFAILRTKPVPFCILDEVEAALDEANVERFAKYVKEFSEETQFIVVTHRKGTMEMADVLYGVTMEEAGVSKILSVRLQEANQLIEE